MDAPDDPIKEGQNCLSYDQGDKQQSKVTGPRFGNQHACMFLVCAVSALMYHSAAGASYAFTIFPEQSYWHLLWTSFVAGVLILVSVAAFSGMSLESSFMGDL